MQRCISSLGCVELSLDGVLALAAKHELDAVELRGIGGILDVPAYFAREFGTPEKLANHLRGSRVRIAALDTGLRLAGGTAVERNQFLEFVPWAEALGVRWLRVFDGGASTLAAETVRWWRELRCARNWRVDLMVETHDSLFTAEAIEGFLARAPGTRILWDSHHTWRRGGEDPVATWRAIRASVVHVHVKDSVDVPSAKHPFTYVLPGDGQFPIASVLAALHEGAFAGPVSLEWERWWHPYLPPLEAALVAAQERGWW